jgi:PAS domain S-box-containing protein
MKVRTKLNLLLAAFTTLFLITLIIINSQENHKTQLYVETLRATNAGFFERIVTLKGTSLRALSVDYTYWDEMVSFVKTRDREWAKNNLDTALSTFDADAMWVYRPDTSLVYSVATPVYRKLSVSVLPPRALMYLYSHGPFSHFYVSSPFGPIEIRGATIQPTNDPDRKTPARGYFFVGRVWDRAYLQELSDLTKNDVRLLPMGADNAAASPRPVPLNIIRTSTTLRGWDGKPLTILEAQRTPAIVEDLQRAAGAQFLLLVFFGLGMIGLLTFSLLYWVNLPLNLISETLKTKNPNALDRLARDRTEFGHLATLIRKFFAQSELIAEVTKRRQAEAELHVSEERFRELVQNASEVVYTHDLTGRFTSLNPSSLKLLGYTAEEASGLTIQQVVAPEDQQKIIAFMHGSQGDVLPPTIEVNVLTRDRRRIPLEISIRSMDSDGKSVGVQGIGRDITERREAESRVRREAARTEALLQIAGRLNTTLDLDTVFEKVCESAARGLNASAAAVRLCDPKSATLRFAKAIGLPPSYRQYVRPIGGAALGHPSLEQMKVLALPYVRGLSDSDDAGFYGAMNIHSAAIALLKRGETLLGSLDVYTIGDARQFSEDELVLLQGLADQATLAISNAQSFRDAQRRLEHVQALRTIDLAITGSLDMRVALDVLLSEVVTQLRIDAADILLLNPHTQTLDFAAGRGLTTSALRHTHLRIGEGHAGRAVVAREPISSNLLEDPGSFLRSPLLAAEGFISYYAVPLIAKGAVKGVLEIFHRAPLAPDEEWLDFLDALGGQAAIAIDGATLFTDLQQSNADLMLAYDTTLEGWSRALELRDEETEGHTQRVTELVLRLARSLGVPDSELVHIRRGSLLHDIGKMAIPDAILRKPGPLTDEEWVLMRRHPMYAYEMLAPITYLHASLDIPYCHHELWDGSGYPRGLKGNTIPLAARIFAVVDVWDALRSDRPYRRAWDTARVRAHIRENAGTRFDPEVVEVFLRMDVAEISESLRDPSHPPLQGVATGPGPGPKGGTASTG